MAWPGADPTALVRAGVPVRPLEGLIGEAGLDAARRAARTWARLWGRVPLLDGQSFRDLVRWREESLLWLAEGFVQHESAGAQCARLAETALQVLEATRADEVDAAGLGSPETVLLARACTARGVLFHGPVPAGRALPPARGHGRSRMAALGGLFRPASAPPLPPPMTGRGSHGVRPLLLMAGHGADVAALRPLLEAAADALGRPVVVVPVADLERWVTRPVRRAVADAETHLKECRGRLRGAPGLHESFSHRGVGFADLAVADIDRLLLDHLPAAVRQLEAVLALVSGPEAPEVAVISGCARDERRTLVCACAQGGVPAVALHAAPVGPDDVDRDDGGPRPVASLTWEPGSDPAPAVERLREAARASVSRE